MPTPTTPAAGTTPRRPRTPRTPAPTATPAAGTTPAQPGYLSRSVDYIRNHPYASFIGAGLVAVASVCSYYSGKFVERNYEQRIEFAVQTKDIDEDGLQPDLGVKYLNGRVIPLYLSKERDKYLSKEGILKRYEGLDKLVNKPYKETKPEDKKPNPISEPLPIIDPTKPDNPKTFTNARP